MIIEKLLQLAQVGSQLTGFAITVPGSIYMVESWSGNEVWEKAQVRAKEEEISLNLDDYLPAKLPEKDDLLRARIFLKELNAPREDRLVSWGKLAGVTRKNGTQRLNPATGESIFYQDFFWEEMLEKAAREKLKKLAEPSEKRLDQFAKVLMSKPSQPVYATLDRTDEQTASSYIAMFQNLLGSLESSALMAIRTGDPLPAIEKMEVMERFCATFRNSNLIGCLLERAGRTSIDQVIWEGLRLRSWNDQQLERLAGLVARREFQDNLDHALAYEAAWMLDLLKSSGGPLARDPLVIATGQSFSALFFHWWNYRGAQGWEGHRKAFVVNHHLDLLAWLDEKVTERKAFPSREMGPKWSPMWALKASLPMVERAADKIVEEGPTGQALVLAAIACERHFLKKKAYPEKLGALALKIPLTDLTDPAFRELAYQLGPQGRPFIWSRAEEVREKNKKRRRLRWQYFQEEEREPVKRRGLRIR